jgi:hypothetical protein
MCSLPKSKIETPVREVFLLLLSSMFHDSSLDCGTNGPARDIPRFSLVPPVNAETAVSDRI